ncbi:MAG: hypothetical protein IBJ17_10630 [Reyranella sp.]|nr:hypothetical protein [Reyranella sp.]
MFLTLTPETPLLLAKRERGFPHIRFDIPVSVLESVEFDLCRFNVARNRSNQRRGPSPTVSGNQSDGRYYPGKRLPVARLLADKQAMLKKHSAKSIEVQVKDRVPLSDSVVVACFSEADKELADQILSKVECRWKTALQIANNYPRSERYAAQVEAYCRRALLEPGWRGDGLEFDRFS